ncbi:MAG: Lrp/AsnC ligand binding domain-containing protein [Alphaproteobacteria bacterium]
MKAVFIMVKCELGKAYDVADLAIQNVDQISEIYSTSGQYDLLIKAYLENEQDVGHFVTERVQTLANVRDTFTIITFKAFT